MQSALVQTAPAVRSPQPSRAHAPAVRRAEWIILAFLPYALVMTLLTPVSGALRLRVCLINAAAFLLVSLLIRAEMRRPSLAISVVRDWLPLALLILAYREMGWLAQPHAGAVLESRWVVWDRALLRGGARQVIESLGPFLPSVLEISYALVYTLAPLSLALLYLYRRRDQADRFLGIFVLGVLLCYAQFPFWPSEPPRAVFFGQDFPSYDTIFRRFNWWMLGAYGIHTSVFPSAHVAGAFSAAFGLREALPSHRWAGRLMTVMAVLIAVATVYGRYHYLADAAAGFLMAALAAGLLSTRRSTLEEH